MKHLLWIKNVGAVIDIDRQSTSSGDYGLLCDAMKTQSHVRADRWDFADIVELDPRQCLNGVYWEWELAGPGGARYRLHILPGVSDEQVSACEAHIRRSFDCLQLTRNRIDRLIDFQMPELTHAEVDMYSAA